MQVFEGNKGFMDVISGRFQIDWTMERLDRVQQTLLKKYNAEIHCQTAIEGALQLRNEHGIDPAQIARVDVRTFEVAHKIVGGGEEDNKTIVRTKEEADHSLPYVLAVALLDGRVMPEQYRHERIQRRDVQNLLRKVVVYPDDGYSSRFPGAMMAHVRVTLNNGISFEREVENLGPPSWQWAQQKFETLAGSFISAPQRAAVIDAVSNIEHLRVAELITLLATINSPGRETPEAAA
jgi:2-methylcitrate dehydratase